MTARRIPDRFGRGFGTALVTPFGGDGCLDEAALGRLVDHVVGGGCDFLVALGSTGEAAMLSEDERDRAIDVIQRHAGPSKLYVGASSASTAQSIRWVHRAKQLGADGALVAAPNYVKPTPDGVVAHFAAINDAEPSLPVIAYNVPSRTSINMTREVVQRLWQLPNVVALKESSGDLLQIARIAAELPAGRALLAGDDALLLPTIAVGGHGVVSVAGNVVPKAMADLVAAARADKLTAARARLMELIPLFDALAAEPNPVPIKCALQLCGLPVGLPRLPLLPANSATEALLRDSLQGRAEIPSHV